MKDFKLKRADYRPGYGDMRGGSHGMTLRETETGAWIMECRDRETHADPAVTVVHEVSREAVLELETFLRKKVLSLRDRPEDDVFLTDYHPWSFGFDYEETRRGKTVRGYCSLSQYRKYSRRDRAVLSELFERFPALRGEKISETVEAD